MAGPMNARAMPKPVRIRKTVPAVSGAGEREGEEEAGADRLRDLRQGEDGPAVEPVGDGAGDEDEDQRRRKLDQPDDAEIVAGCG